MDDSFVGGYYGDVPAYVNDTCKSCGTGKVVDNKRAPGLDFLDCRVCPTGNV